MATIYGATTNHWRCYINTWSSEDGYSVSAGLTVGIQDCGWGFQIWTGIVGHSSANGADSEVNTSFNTSTGSWSTKDITSSSQRFVKGHSAYNITLSGWVRNQSGYMNGTSSASQTITVPALEHHYVSFNANGGTGAPGRADKWYGEQVTIPNNKPTRTNYEFLGWSDSKTGSVKYQPGQKYWIDDRDVTYYAIWKILYVAPKFESGLALRTGSLNSTTVDYSGGYCYASFTYKVDTTVYSDNVAKSIICNYYKDSIGDPVSVSLTGDLDKASGTVNAHFEASINSTYYIECVLIDNKDGKAVIARSISTGVLPMEIGNQGKSVGILSAAPSSAGLALGGSGNPEFTIAADTTNDKLESMAQIHGSTSTTGQGELTLSTQGLDSDGNIARGTINLVADGVNLNGCNFIPKVWTLYEKNGSDNYDRSGSSSWWTDGKISENSSGPNNNGYWRNHSDLANGIQLISPGVWFVVYKMMMASKSTNQRFAVGIFDENNTEISSSSTYAPTNTWVTCYTTAVFRLNGSEQNLKFNAKNDADGTFMIGRIHTAVLLFHLGPVS